MPLPIPDEESLRRAVLSMENAPATPARARSRAAIAARARVLGLQHLVPADWRAPSADERRSRDPAAMRAAASAAAAARTFDCKAHGCGLPPDVLQEAYMRAVREWALIPDAERPPIPREAYAQARVNSIVRYALNDASARNDDADLIPTAAPARSEP